MLCISHRHAEGAETHHPNVIVWRWRRRAISIRLVHYTVTTIQLVYGVMYGDSTLRLPLQPAWNDVGRMREGGLLHTVAGANVANVANRGGWADGPSGDVGANKKAHGMRLNSPLRRYSQNPSATRVAWMSATTWASALECMPRGTCTTNPAARAARALAWMQYSDCTPIIVTCVMPWACK